MSGRIIFFTYKIKYRIEKKRKLSLWLEEVIESYGKIRGDINIILVSDKYLRKLNHKYLGKKSYTDTISFRLSEEEEVISGDVFISIQRVKENAKLFGNSLNDELSRVMVHSILHLIDLNDETKEEKKLMNLLENKFLKRLKNF
jgi:rRNA maturation RNase YbeY